MTFDTSVPIPMRSMCATPNMVLTNIMACRVYRRTKAGFFREAEISTTALSERKRKPDTPIAFYVSEPQTTSDQPYHVGIELPDRSQLHPSDANPSSYEVNVSRDTIQVQVKDTTKVLSTSFIAPEKDM